MGVELSLSGVLDTNNYAFVRNIFFFRTRFRNKVHTGIRVQTGIASRL